MLKDGITYNLPSILIGSIVAGIIVTIIANFLNKWKEERSKKREIFELLIKTKNYNDINNINSLNLIPIIFKRNDKVILAYRELVKEVHREKLEAKSYEFAYNEVITQIGRDINYYGKSERYINDSEYVPEWVISHEKSIKNGQKLLEIQLKNNVENEMAVKYLGLISKININRSSLIESTELNDVVIDNFINKPTINTLKVLDSMLEIREDLIFIKEIKIQIQEIINIYNEINQDNK